MKLKSSKSNKHKACNWNLKNIIFKNKDFFHKAFIRNKDEKQTTNLFETFLDRFVRSDVTGNRFRLSGFRQNLFEFRSRFRIPAGCNNSVSSADEFANKTETDSAAAASHKINSLSHLLNLSFNSFKLKNSFYYTKQFFFLHKLFSIRVKGKSMQWMCAVKYFLEKKTKQKKRSSFIGFCPVT